MQPRAGLSLNRYDALTLAAAFVGAVAMASAADHDILGPMACFRFSPRGRVWPSSLNWVMDLAGPARRIQYDFRWFLSIASVALGIVFFRKPAARRWRALRKPGVAAVGAALVVVAGCIAYTATPIALASHRRMQSLLGTDAPCWFELDVTVTGAILGSWTYLWLVRLWRPRRDWADWLGRWLGWCWLSTIAFDALSPILWG
jgi:hypothetical protein